MKQLSLNKEIDKNLKPTKTVYSYYFPETRKIISKITKKFPHSTYLKSISPGLDNFHQNAINAYIKNTSEQLPNLESLKHQYVTAGASEAIFHILANIATNRRTLPLYTLEGEYEGYREYGRNLGLIFKEVKSISNLIKLPKGIVFISNPSARDGNIIPNSEILKLARPGHKIILDATYVGLTKPHKFLTIHKNIESVVVSLSKPFGIYYHRIGFCFSNKEYKTLEANKWFKNILSLIIVDRMLKTFPCSYFYDKYKNFQKMAIKQLKEDYEIESLASDVVLLSNTKEALNKNFDQFKRINNYRFCLTPYFLNYEEYKTI